VRLSIDTWIKLGIIVGAWIIGGTVAWVTLKGQVNANAEDVAEASMEIKKHESESNVINTQQNNDIIVLQSDVKDIKNDVNSLVMDSKEDRKILNQILGKLENK
jgi:hypothetical protein